MQQLQPGPDVVHALLLHAEHAALYDLSMRCRKVHVSSVTHAAFQKGFLHLNTLGTLARLALQPASACQWLGCRGSPAAEGSSASLKGLAMMGGS